MPNNHTTWRVLRLGADGAFKVVHKLEEHKLKVATRFTTFTCFTILVILVISIIATIAIPEDQNRITLATSHSWIICLKLLEVDLYLGRLVPGAGDDQVFVDFDTPDLIKKSLKLILMIQLIQ